MMWRKFTIYLIIIVLCNCDDFFIVNKYEGARYYCITNSSFALSWIIEDTSVSTDVQQVSHFLPKPQHLWNIGDELIENKWQYKKTFSKEIILDRRWERMKIYKTDYVEDNTNSILKFTTIKTSLTTNFYIPFSIRIKNDAHIFLCDDADVTNSNCYWFILFGFSGTKSAIRKCPQSTIPSTNWQSVKTPCNEFQIKLEHNSSQFLKHGSWNHFILSKAGNTFALKLPNGSPIVSYSDRENVFNVKHLIIHSKNNIGLWKFHEIDYYFSLEEKEMKFQTPIQVIDDSMCISMFAKMCETCAIKLEISSRDNPNAIIKRIFMREISGWQEIKLENVNISSNKIYLTLSTINRLDPNPHWKIGDISQCGKNNLRMVQLEEMADCQLVSHKTETISLNESNQIEETQFLESYKCRGNEIGRSCIPCGWFTDDGCNNMKICEKNNRNTQCSCSAGYKFKNKNICSRCQNGYYGYFCRNKCSEHCRNCNNVNGTCSSCTENYSGSKCDIPPIHFKKVPSIIDLEYTNLSTTLNNFDKSGNTNGSPYVVQYNKSQSQTQEWMKFADSFKSGEKIIIKRNSFDERDKNPTFNFATKCDSVTEKDLIVKPSNTSSTIFVPQKQLTCPLTIRSVELTYPSDTNDVFYINISSSNNKIILSDLKPFQKYEVLIKTNHNEIRKLFKTTEGVPEKISNLTATTNNINVRLTWKKPKETNGELTHYIVNYKLKKFNGCGDAVSECCEQTTNVTQENIILSDLKPYTTMLFSISAANSKFEGISEEIELSIPASDYIHNEEISKFEVLNIKARSAVLQFSSINCTKMRGPLIIMLNGKCSQKWCKNINATKEYNSNVHLPSLSAFTNYTFELKFCRSNITCSSKVERFHFQTEPEPPNPVRNFTVYTKNSTSLSLRWMPPFPPTGILEGYNVKYLSDKNFVSKNITITTPCRLWGEFICFTLTNLNENQNYDIEIRAINKPETFGQHQGSRYITKIELPEQPPGLKISWTLQNDLNISWQHPIEAHGYIERFDITVLTTLPNDTFNIRHKLNVTENDYQPIYLHIIKAKDLLESTKYKIVVRAYNGIDGKNSSLEIFSPPDIPLFETAPTFKLSHNTIEIETSEIKNMKNNDTYKLFLLIPSDEIDASTYPHELTPLERNLDIKTSHFRIAHQCHYKTIQNPTTEKSSNECEHKFSTILSEDAKIVSVLLVHTDSNNQTSYKLYSFALDKPEAAIHSAIYLSLLGLLLLLLLIPAAVIIYKKRHTINEMTVKKNIGATSADMESLTEAGPLIASPEKPDIIIHSKISSKGVPLKQFEQYVKESLSSGDLERQHALVPRGQTKPWECGALPENKSKNRYINLVAYDHTRVVLTKVTNQEHSDYINANYIDGYKTPKAYIATQGPIKTTIGDFWRMIWQENVRHIAMLANNFEAGKKKCEIYWPDKNTTTSFENIHVHFKSSQVFPDYGLRIFDVVYNNERRTVNQYHFFSWPDEGVPFYPESLVPFLQNLQKLTYDSNSPIVVHCSGGVGRTGIIILSDICVRMAAEEKAVDVLRIFQKLRDQRPNMVDNFQHYKFAHLVILKYLQKIERDI